MKQSWEPIILVNCSNSRRCSVAALLLLVTALGVSAAVAKPPKKKHLTPKPQAPKMVGAAGLIAAARHELDLNHLSTAIDYANSASRQAPVLDDYAQEIRAQAEYRSGNYAEVDQSATRVFNQTPLSPLVGSVAALAVRADLDGDRPKQALELVKKYFDRIPQPQSDLLLARSLEANGDLLQAAERYQRVYYQFPVSKEATDAANALVNLKARLGESYPPPMPDAMLGRAGKLIQAHNPQAARIEFTAAIPQLAGAERDLARVRLGEVDFQSGNARAAFEYLTGLKVDESEADAERLSYLVRCARKLDHQADVKPMLEHLEQQHPNSPWRLDALIYVADQARTDNDSSAYLPLYQACATTFSNEPRSAWCAWRIAYESYRKDAPDTGEAFRKYIQSYPGSPDVNNALYFWGRSEERKNNLAVARACYDQLVARFPNTYFAVLARERLKDPGLPAAVPDPSTLEFLKSVSWPPREEFPSFTPGKTAQLRLNRAQLLHLTGLDDLAEGELKFGARNDGEQQNLYAYQLARLAADRNAPDQALRYIKAYAPDYLFMPLDQAPATFWQLAFPLPYRSSIEQYSRSESLDPFLVAALIRQESEFNAQVISHANAYGLMQVLPASGRQLSKHFGIRRFNADSLLTPERNIQLGTYYFHNLLSSFGGQTELALASYNAGPGRAALWRTWGPFREPAEFIEAVPFHETRGYIQIVLRNTEVYQRLYSGTSPNIPAYHPKPPPKSKVKRRRPASKAAAPKTG